MIFLDYARDGVSFRPKVEKALQLSLRLSLSNTYGRVLLSNPTPFLKVDVGRPNTPNE